MLPEKVFETDSSASNSPPAAGLEEDRESLPYIAIKVG